MPFTGFEEFFLYNNGCGLRYWLREGDGSEYAVLLHGAGRDHRALGRQLDAFGKGSPALAWDARGHGASELHPGKRFSFADMADDLELVLKRHAIKKAALVGESMGASLALDAALRSPERAVGLVLIGSAGSAGRLGFWDRLFLMAARPKGPLALWKIFVESEARAASKDFAVQAYVRECLSRMRPDVCCDALLSFSASQAGASSRRLPLPTLALSGERDSAIRRGKGALGDPNMRFVEVAGAGRLAGMENPRAVNFAIREYLQIAPE
jgi:pimeloyl-ACP methyl ester carboxylesterase